MAEPSSIVHLTSHPNCLRSHGPSVYKDESQRTWVHLLMDTENELQVWLCQVNIQSEHIPLSSSPLTSSIMPSMWTLHLGSQYLDSMGRFWRIVFHGKEDDTEEMVLELMDNSQEM